MRNLDTARAILEQLIGRGVEEFCLCGGSRNAPLLAVAAASDRRNYAFSDEGSAAFFAMGRARHTRRPVAVITTSGTAVAEMVPAAIEAYYSGTPLVLVSADRPARYHRTGAPQAIEQRGIFGPYAKTIDLAAGDPVPEIDWCHDSPIHINVAFDEPLIDGDVADWSGGASAQSRPQGQGKKGSAIGRRPTELSQALETWKQPLLLVGGLQSEDRAAVREFALRLGAPVYAEPMSGLREDPALQAIVVKSGERILRRGNFDGVLRIGDVPALRFWRDLDESLSAVPVVSVNRLNFAGLSRGVMIHAAITEVLESVKTVPGRKRQDDFAARDMAMAAELGRLLDAEPASELSLVRSLSSLPPPGAHVYLGNSLPIREWDLAALRSRHFDYGGNRGANGIDGQLSTFFGGLREGAQNWCVVGDLTAIYDLSAPWILRDLDPALHLRVVIINNGGGRIFSRVASLKNVDEEVRERYFEDAHEVSFEHWAAMWGLAYQRWDKVPDQPQIPQRAVIELTPDPEASERVWDRYEELWSRS